ncbi:hypothetical protein QJ856_gp1129 [Tupanvirus deep ocean]|uniref:Uncharacterized protein n=2 Tax=Tupanvirus TaxID=2094720 RepID=A0AC62A780_9VIRU|nr:hypothetical protein QJ856_gp1129 [Tupanvirus deep ocean]QKU33629.1 hypothetical protein [Tupanvirus deep ocean]
MTDLGDYMTVSNIVAIILGIIGLIWLIYGLWRNWKINKISTWPKTNAFVLNSVAEPANNAAGNTYVDPRYIIATTDNKAQYIPKVTYRYRVGNREYQSNHVVYSGSRSYNAVDIKTLLGQVHAGATIPIFYNPNNPNESYIYNGTSSYTGVIIGLVLLLIAGYLGYYHNYKNKTITTTDVPVTGTRTSITRNNDLASPNLTDIDATTRRNTVTRNTRVVAGPTVTAATTQTTAPVATGTTRTTVAPATFYRRDFY